VSNVIEHKGGETPAMKEGITDHVWTWRKFLTYHISYDLGHYPASPIVTGRNSVSQREHCIT